MDSNKLTTSENTETQAVAEPEMETEKPEVDPVIPEVVVEEPQTRIERLSSEVRSLLSPHLELESKFEKVSTLVDEERQSFEVSRVNLGGSELRDSFRTLAAGIDGVCKDANKLLMSWAEKIQRLTESVCGLHDALDGRIKDEDLSKWLVRVDTKEEIELQAAEKEAEAKSAEYKAGLAKVAVLVAESKQQVLALEEMARKAADDATRARSKAKRTAQAAEEARWAAERKRKAAEVEEKKREEEAKRRKEEEEEERRKEEVRRKAELENGGDGSGGHDIRTWPLYIYSVIPGDAEISVGCVIRAAPGQLSEDDVQVERIDQLDAELDLEDGEELVSNIISVRSSKTKDLKFDIPLSVATPFITGRNVTSRETVVKVLYLDDDDRKDWTEVIAKDTFIDKIKEFKFADVRLSRLGVRLAVVTRLRKETFVVSKQNLRIVSSVDHRISFNFKPTAVRRTGNITLEVQPVDLMTVQDVRNKPPPGSNTGTGSSSRSRLLASSSIVRLSSAVANEMPKALTVNVPLPPNPAKQRRPVSSTERPNERGGGGRSEPPPATTARGRPKTARSAFMITPVEDDLDDNVRLMVKDGFGSDYAWSEMNGIILTESRNKDLVTCDLEKPIITRFMCLRLLPGADAADAVAIAKQLETATLRRTVQVVLRQRKSQPTSVTVHCLSAVKIDRIVRKLTEDGFSVSPGAVDPEVVLREGQELVLRFRGNLCEASGRAELRTNFNSNMRTHWDFEASVLDRYAQKAIDCYRGFVQIYARTQRRPKLRAQEMGMRGSNKLLMAKKGGSGAAAAAASQLQEPIVEETMLCELLVTLPKPPPGQPKTVIAKVPVVIKSGGPIDVGTLQHLSKEIGEDWRYLAQYLNIRRARLQAILRNNITSTSSNGDSQQAVYEMLTTWMKKMPRASNKLEILRQALVACERYDLTDYLDNKQEETKRQQYICNKDATFNRAVVFISRHAHLISDWRVFSRQLGLSEAEIDDIEHRYNGPQDRCFQSLKKWQGNAPDEKICVDSLVNHLRECRCTKLADMMINDFHR